jgi:hypothetical protein
MTRGSTFQDGYKPLVRDPTKNRGIGIMRKEIPYRAAQGNHAVLPSRTLAHESQCLQNASLSTEARLSNCCSETHANWLTRDAGFAVSSCDSRPGDAIIRTVWSIVGRNMVAV